MRNFELDCPERSWTRATLCFSCSHHLIVGELLYAATSNVPCATLLARTFDIDVKACARCGGRLDVRALVTDHDIVRRILDAISTTARAPPPLDSTIAYEPAFA